MRWYLLVHQLPPKPPYLRAKIGQRLSKVGAVAIKNSVYLLPFQADCLEDLQWIAGEARAGGGEAHVLEARFTEGRDAELVVRKFRAERESDYRTFGLQVRRLERALSSRAKEGERETLPTALARLRRKLEEIRRTDFFGAPIGKEITVKLRRLEERLRRTAIPQRRPRSGASGDLVGRTWVTRRGVKVDRIASAWLVRRFVDARARFRFVDPKAPRGRRRELRFDMVDGDFSHEGNRCTFETLVFRVGIRDQAVARIAEIVHDIDLKDAKYGRPETSGIQRLIDGVIAAHPEDLDRVRRGGALFDDLYASFRRAGSLRKRTEGT